MPNHTELGGWLANFATNITGSINMFGPQPSTKFGSRATFGVAKFGNGEASQFNMPVRVLTYQNETGPTFSDSSSGLNFLTGPQANTAIVSNGSTQVEQLRENSGRYLEVLAGGVTNDEYAFVPTYTNQSRPSNSWTQSTTSTISWVTG